MASLDNSLDIIVDSIHSLIDAPSPAYSNLTVRRAFIVWMYCGQANKFKDVCNYYHRLEALEEKMSPSDRALSRHHEFALFMSPPPISKFLDTHFPKLYSNDPIDPYYIQKVESIKNEKFIFKLEGFNDLKQKGVTTEEIFKASQDIRKYCKTRQCTLREFLQNFRQYATVCQLQDTVHNVVYYIKKKELKAELVLYLKKPPGFSFLDTTDKKEEEKDDEMSSITSDSYDFLSDQNSLVEIESLHSDETMHLKIILGVPPATSSPKKIKIDRYNKENVNTSNIENGKYTPHEFFKSFDNNLEASKINTIASSYSPLTPKIEDFVWMYDSQNMKKSRSVDALDVKPSCNVVQTLSFSSQEFFDASLAIMADFKKLRNI